MIVLVLFFLVACASRPGEVGNIAVPPSEPGFDDEVHVDQGSVNPDLSTQLQSLQEELNFVHSNGGQISPVRKTELESQLEELERQGADVKALKELLGEFQPAAYSGSSAKACEQKLPFTHAPLNLDKVEYIVPLGQMAGEHVTPTDHQYYSGPDENTMIEIYAPADGKITFVQHMTQPVADPGSNRKVDDYYIMIEHGCGLASAYIHVDNPVSTIVQGVQGESYTYLSVPVKAGQFLGTFHGVVDYNIFDKKAKVNFIVPESYRSSRYLEVQDPFEYYNDEIKAVMQAKSLRSAAPMGGKIDYDVDGTLVGNWFEVGTNKFAGLKQERYWAGHLSFVYHHIDPSLVMVSVGTYLPEKAQQFAVYGNVPDPQNVTPQSGMVKYELTNLEYYDGSSTWDRKTHAKPLTAAFTSYVQGVALVEMVHDRKIKFEVFPGKTAADVTGFTDNAKYFER